MLMPSLGDRVDKNGRKIKKRGHKAPSWLIVAEPPLETVASTKLLKCYFFKGSVHLLKVVGYHKKTYFDDGSTSPAVVIDPVDPVPIRQAKPLDVVYCLVDPIQHLGVGFILTTIYTKQLIYVIHLKFWGVNDSYLIPQGIKIAAT